MSRKASPISTKLEEIWRLTRTTSPKSLCRRRATDRRSVRDLMDTTHEPRGTLRGALYMRGTDGGRNDLLLFPQWFDLLCRRRQEGWGRTYTTVMPFLLMS